MVAERRGHVLLTTDTIGGVWTYTVELARGLNAAGVDVTLAAMGAPLGPSRRADVASLARTTVHARECKLEWVADAWDDVEAAGTWLLDLERWGEPPAQPPAARS